MHAALAANQVLAEMYRTGRVTLPDGSSAPTLEHGLPQEEGKELYDLVRAYRPGITLEVGMAHGKSTLWICQALADNGKGRHIAMDPWQDNYPGGPSPGLWNLEQAGLRHLVEFHLDSSHRVLPALELRGQQIDFAFIDGFHTFDHTLTDFFLIDKMLTLDGLIVFDDVSWPSVRKVVRFVLGNRPYSRCGPPLWPVDLRERSIAKAGAWSVASVRFPGPSGTS